MIIIHNEFTKFTAENINHDHTDFSTNDMYTYLNDNLYKDAPVHTIDVPVNDFLPGNTSQTQRDFINQLGNSYKFYGQLIILLKAFTQIIHKYKIVDPAEHGLKNLSCKLLVTPSNLIPELNSPNGQEEAKKYLVNIKKNLEEIYFLVARTQLREVQLRNILTVMFSQLDVCAPGLQSSLLIIKSDLQIGDINTVLSKFRFDIISIFHATQMIGRNDNNSIHLLKNLVDHADSFGFKIGNVDLTSSQDRFSHTMQLSGKVKNDLKNHITEKYTLANFVTTTAAKIRKDITAVCQELHIPVINSNIKYSHFNNLEHCILQALKQYGVVEGSCTSIPNGFISISGDVYEDIKDYTVIQCDDFPFVKNDRTIYLANKSNQNVASFDIGNQTFEVILSDKYSDLFAEISTQNMSFSIVNIEYYLLQVMMEKNLCQKNIYKQKLDCGALLNLNFYGPTQCCATVTMNGLITSLHDADDNVAIQAINTCYIDPLVQLLCCSAASNDLRLVQLIITHRRYDLPTWLLEALYDISATYGFDDQIKMLFDNGVAVYDPKIDYHFNKKNALLSSISICQIDRRVLIDIIFKTFVKIDMSYVKRFILQLFDIEYLSSYKSNLIFFPTLKKLEDPQKVNDVLVFLIDAASERDYKFRKDLLVGIFDSDIMATEDTILYFISSKASQGMFGDSFAKIVYRLPEPKVLELVDSLLSKNNTLEFTKGVNVLSALRTFPQEPNSRNFLGWCFDHISNVKKYDPVVYRVIFHLLALRYSTVVNRGVGSKLAAKYEKTLLEKYKNYFENPILIALELVNLDIINELFKIEKYSTAIKNTPPEQIAKVLLTECEFDKIKFCLEKNLFAVDSTFFKVMLDYFNSKTFEQNANKNIQTGILWQISRYVKPTDFDAFFKMLDELRTKNILPVEKVEDLKMLSGLFDIYQNQGPDMDESAFAPSIFAETNTILPSYTQTMANSEDDRSAKRPRLSLQP